MENRIEHIKYIHVVGMCQTMTLQNIGVKTKAMAQQFMPRRHEVKNRIGNHVYSIQNYKGSLSSFTPETEFEKWVAVQVEDNNVVPEGMSSFILKGGVYAVFIYKGSAKDFPQSRQYIFREWLPKSGYRLDERAHFEILSEDYSKDLDNVEEEVWIPVIKI